jgi:hypothetical protein
MLSRSPLRHSPTVNLLWRWVEQRLAGAIAEKQAALSSFVPDDRPYVATGPRIELPSHDDVFRHLVGTWKNSSLQMHRLARANGIRYFHFLQPSQYLEGTKRMGAEEREVAIVKNTIGYQYGTKEGYPLMIAEGAALREHGVAFFDLTRIFEDVDEAVYMDTSGHLNLQGNAILSAEIATRVATSWDFRARQ